MTLNKLNESVNLLRMRVSESELQLNQTHAEFVEANERHTQLRKELRLTLAKRRDARIKRNDEFEANKAKLKRKRKKQNESA